MDDVLVCGAKGVRIFLGFGGNLNGVGCPRRLKPGCARAQKPLTVSAKGYGFQNQTLLKQSFKSICGTPM